MWGETKDLSVLLGDGERERQKSDKMLDLIHV